jgi:hypothetical protein
MQQSKIYHNLFGRAHITFKYFDAKKIFFCVIGFSTMTGPQGGGRGASWSGVPIRQTGPPSIIDQNNYPSLGGQQSFPPPGLGIGRGNPIAGIGRGASVAQIKTTGLLLHLMMTKIT